MVAADANNTHIDWRTFPLSIFRYLEGKKLSKDKFKINHGCLFWQITMFLSERRGLGSCSSSWYSNNVCNVFYIRYKSLFKGLLDE